MSGRTNPTVASLSADLAQFQATSAALQAEVAALRNKNTTLTTDLGTLRTKNTSLTQNLTTLRTENVTAQAVAAAAAQQLQAAQTTANQAAANAAAALAAAQQGQAQPVQGGGGGGGNVVRLSAMFAATPAMVDHEQIIDYKTKTGVMVYDEGCKALTTPFDMKSNGTVVFITELQAKCMKMGWSTGRQQITHFDNSATPPKRINIIDEYGQIDVPTPYRLQGHLRFSRRSVQGARSSKQHDDEQMHPRVSHPGGASSSPPFPIGVRDKRRRERPTAAQESDGHGLH